jgi:FXSXX-COOH protein
MDDVEPEIEGNLAELNEMPLAQVLLLDDRDTVLANSLRRIVDGAGRRAADTVAAFNNYI